jgi:predicted flap endonuclease-1-like 5' DNA nuclease
MAMLEDLEGIAKTYKGKLKDAGFKTTDDLLKAGATPAGRKKIAASTGVSEKRILRWVNLADLFRIKGIGEEYSDLLEAAGVDTVPELAQRNPENLHQKTEEINAKKKLVRRTPSLTELTDWIKQAKKLPRKVNY